MTTYLSLGDEIVTYLQGLSTLSTPLNFDGAGDINLFSSLLPDEPDLAVAVLERGGLPPVMTLTGAPTGGSAAAESKIGQPVFQVRVRSGMEGYVVGNALMQSVFKALHGINETVLNGSPNGLFHLIAAMQSPVYLGRGESVDKRQRHNWSVNFRVIWDNPAQ